MTKQTIASGQWQSFFQHLNNEYAQKPATLEMVPEIAGPQLVAFDQPFGGVTSQEVNGRTTLTIHLGEESDLTIETPLRVYTEPFAGGGGQIVEIEVAGMPLTRLYLSHRTDESTGRGEIYGGGAERSVGQAAAPGRAYSGSASSRKQSDSHTGADQPAGRPPEAAAGAISDFEGAGAMGAGIVQDASGGAGFVREADRAPADPPRGYVDEASRAAGIIGEANTGGGYGPPADRGPAASAGRGAQDDAAGGARIASARLGIGLGGVHGVAGGSLGDRDLTGQTDAERIDLEPSMDIGDADVVDLGRDAGVIDTTRDPIGGTGDEDYGMDEGPNMVEGEVGAQAERDLTELFGKRRAAGSEDQHS